MKFNTSVRAGIAGVLSALATVALSQSPASAPARPASTAASAIALPGSAVTVCTDAPRKAWMPEAEFRAIAANRGYKTLKFKVSRGNCYEIYGYDANGQLVEVYFNPMDGRLVKQNNVKP